MRIIVFSDSHGQAGALAKIIDAQPHAERYIFLGDGAADLRFLRRRYPCIDLYAVRGNVDPNSNDPETAEMEICGKKILYTHGHKFHVKQGTELLYAHAVLHKADVVLFGHTHTQHYHFEGGIHFLNPGAAVSGGICQFGIVDITETGIACVAAQIDRDSQ